MSAVDLVLAPQLYHLVVALDQFKSGWTIPDTYTHLLNYIEVRINVLIIWVKILLDLLSPNTVHLWICGSFGSVAPLSGVFQEYKGS